MKPFVVVESRCLCIAYLVKTHYTKAKPNSEWEGGNVGCENDTIFKEFAWGQKRDQGEVELMQKVSRTVREIPALSMVRETPALKMVTETPVPGTVRGTQAPGG